MKGLNPLLKRIADLDPQLNAFITVTADLARATARKATEDIAAGRYRGALHGIPFALKDIYYTAGILTSGGSKICIDNVPSYDAAATRCLHDAGAVLLGKLQTHEFAHGGPSFDLPWPPSRNPWHLEHFTGGSSSGSAATRCSVNATHAGSLRLPRWGTGARYGASDSTSRRSSGPRRSNSSSVKRQFSFLGSARSD